MKRNLDKGYVLVGDIGGSKTHLGLFRSGRKRPRMIVCETFASRDFAGLEAIVTNFAVRHDVTGIPACFGIAGPVIGARPQTTNLPWRISANALARRFGWPRVRFLNDLAATAMALPVLTRKERLILNTAKPQKGGSLALIAPGTGLGQALVIYHNLGYIPVPSEGGHADFSPNSPDEIELWHYLHERYGHVSIERVLSGPGLVNIYSWLRDSGRYREPAWIS